MRKSWIKTKKDWYIAFIFTILVTYVLSDFIWKISVGILTGLSLKEFIMLFFPDKITYASYPATYGNLFVTAVVVTLVSVIVLCRHHAKLKKVLAAAGTGAIVSLGVLAAFHMHCRLIVGTGADNSVFSGDIIARGEADEGGHFQSLSPEKEQDRELVRLCYELEPYKGTELKEVREQYEASVTAPGEKESIHIWLRFPKKYGQEFWLSLHVEGEFIYINQGQGGKAGYTFYKDNGLKEMLDEIMKKQS